MKEGNVREIEPREPEELEVNEVPIRDAFQEEDWEYEDLETPRKPSDGKRKNDIGVRRSIGMVLLGAGAILILVSVGLNILQYFTRQAALTEFAESRVILTDEGNGAGEDADGEGAAAGGTSTDGTEGTVNAQGADQDSTGNSTGSKAAATPTGEVLGIVRIPVIDSEEPVVEGTDKASLKASLGHETGTAIPGEAGNCVIAGHRNYSFGSFFNRLNEVRVGDMIYIDTEDATYSYEVSEIKVVEPEDVGILLSTDEEQLTLYTCTPIYIATHRLVVIAKRVA